GPRVPGEARSGPPSRDASQPAALKTAARAAVAAGLTAYILWRSHPSEVLAALAGADWRLIAIAVALVLVDRALMACRWLLLLCIIDPADRPPLGRIMRIFFVSTFVGTFLPASIGADAVRAYSMTRLSVRGRDAVASVFMDRMLGVASILVVGAVGLLLARDLAGNRTIVLSLIAAGAICALTLVVVFSDRAARLAARAIRLLPARVHEFGDGLLASIRRYSSYHGQLANVLLGSIAVQALRIVQAYFLGSGLGIAAGPATYFAFVPPILLGMVLPVTFNGIGTSQAAFVWFFGRVGIAPPAAFALSILFVALGVVGNLPGGLLYAFGAARSTARHG